jgi:alpha-tubulin suppressor-like RCC1 family protein
VYAWGRGDEGQLGVGDESDHSEPTTVSALASKDIVHIAAGEYHTAFLTGTIQL